MEKKFMKYWLLKTEPSAFSLEDLEAAPKQTASWDGVRNYQARNFLRDDVKVGDKAGLYYSSCAVPGIVAIMTVTRAGYPDSSAFDRKNSHFDAASTKENPRWFMIDVQLERKLKRVITLAELRTHAGGALKNMRLLMPGNRLSVMPVSAAEWRFILKLE
jgi:predicted RNA-binding protein with PUA-like domain